MGYLLPALVFMSLAGKTAVAEMTERFRARGDATPDEFFEVASIPTDLPVGTPGRYR